MYILNIDLDPGTISITFFLLALFLAVVLVNYVRRRRRNEEEFSIPGVVQFDHASFCETIVPEHDQYDTDDEDRHEDISSPLQDLSDDVYVPLSVVKEILGLSILGTCDATTARQAQEKFEEADIDSDDAYLALKKWIELEDNVDNMEEMCRCAKKYHRSLKVIAKEKWDATYLTKITAALTEQELLELASGCPSGGEAERLLIKKLYPFYE